MATIMPNTSIQQFQLFVKEVYGLPNDRHFELADMLTNIQRFAMRALKGIRKGDIEKAKINLMIACSWFMSTCNRLHINLEEEIWKRFSYLCSYCASCPCSCKAQRIEERRTIPIDHTKRPGTLKEFQHMFNQIYPASSRTVEHAGVHLAEEIGEFSEALLAYRGERSDKDFQAVMLEAADCFSCLMGVFNSLDIDLAQELASKFTNNCHVCKQSPCACSFNFVANFKS